MRLRGLGIVATVVLAAVATWWFMTPATVGPFTIGHARAVTVGGCRVPAGPVVLVAGQRRNSPAPELDGVVKRIVNYEAAHSETSRTASIVLVDGIAQVATARLSLLIGHGALAVHNMGQMLSDQRAAVPEADVLASLDTAATTVRRDRPQGVVILQDSGVSTVGALDFRRPPAGLPSPLPDLSGMTVILDGVGDVAAPQPAVPDRAAFRQRWVQIVKAAGATCVGLSDTHRTGPAPSDPDLPAVSLVKF